MKVGWRFCGQPSPLETPINTGGMARLVKGEGWMHWFIFMGIIKQIIGKKESIYYHLEQGYYSLWANVINLTGVRLITLAMWYIGPEEPVPLTQWLKCLIRTRVRNLSLFQMNEICHLVQRCPPIHNLCNTFIIGVCNTFPLIIHKKAVYLQQNIWNIHNNEFISVALKSWH